MAVDISKTGSAIVVSDGTNQKKGFVNRPATFNFNPAGTSLNIDFGGGDSYNIALADLRIQGAGSAPADIDAALSALTTDIFPA